ncbi:MAG TPA: ATP-binding protein [Thermomicrobiaceae bacterium]|nr:ATP-binding protein [Thermomicrobiaceae bacterium]
MCECRLAEIEQQRSRDYAEMSSFGATFESLTFESFDPGIPHVRPAYDAAREFAQNPDGWLFFLGSYGCGKTHLAAAIAHEVLEHQNMRVLFQVVPDLLDHLRSTFAPDRATSYDERFNSIRMADLLVLDDLGTENSTPWATEKLFQIINFRYNDRRPTIISSNRDFKDLDPRIASRLADPRICRPIYIQADDYRMRRSMLAQSPKRRSR